MMVLLLTFAGLPSQIKLKDILLISFAKCFGMESTDALYVSLDKPKVLTIFILPRRVSFLRFQPLRVSLGYLSFLKNLVCLHAQCYVKNICRERR